MSIKFLKPFQQTGDTIVEVLVVIIVMGVVVTSGYRVAVRSLQSTQLAQEKSYALKLAEGQLESLKAAANTNPGVLSTASGFCLNGTTPTAINSPGPTANMDDDNYGSYQDECKKNPNGGACAGICYHVGIKRLSPTEDNYTASVRWDGPRGNKQQIVLSYRLYP